MDFGNFTSQRIFTKNKQKKRHTINKNDRVKNESSKNKKKRNKNKQLEPPSCKSQKCYEPRQKRKGHNTSTMNHPKEKKKGSVQMSIKQASGNGSTMGGESSMKSEMSGPSRNDNDCALRLEPRDVMILNRDVDEDEVNKLVMKFKDKPKVEPLPVIDAKSQLVLDRVTKKSPAPKCVLEVKKKKKKKKVIKDSDSRATDEAELKSISEPPKELKIAETEKKPEKKDDETENLQVKTADDGEEKKSDEDDKEEREKRRQNPDLFEKYDTYPKLEEVLKMEKEDIFDLTGAPKWMEYFEPKESDIQGVEPPYAVGSEHIEMFHDKKITMKNAPPGKVLLDQWLDIATLLNRDEDYFSPELIFCNTLKSLINVSSSKNMPETKKKAKKEEEDEDNVMKTQCDDDETCPVMIVDPNPMKYYSYSRENPVETAHQMIFVDKTIPPKKEKTMEDDLL